MIEHRKAEKIVDALTEVMPGRPTIAQHRHPIDNVREPYKRDKVQPISRLHALTIMSAEQQTMNFYMNVGPMYMEPIARQLYQEKIGRASCRERVLMPEWSRKLK